MNGVNNVSLYAFRVSLRWAMRKKFPNELDNWTEENWKTVQSVADECDQRLKNRYEPIEIET